MPSLLAASFFGVIAAVITSRLLNRYRLSRYFFYPPLVSLSLMVIYTQLGGGWEIRDGQDPVVLLPVELKDEMRERTKYWDGMLK